MIPLTKRAAVAALLLSGVTAQDTTAIATATGSVPSACATLTPAYSPPVVAKGWKAQLIATGLTRPRGIKSDSNGGLLVVEQGVGLTHLTLNDNGGTCVSVAKNVSVIEDSKLNHGLELSEDGRALYVSSSEYVDRYHYDPDTAAVGERTRLVANMTNPGGGHSTRSLLLSKSQPDLLLVSRGSATNIDPLAADQSTGVSSIRAFNISDAATGENPYDYPSDGLLVGWGLRNSVGVAEHPVTGTIWSVENSADNVARLGQDIHEDNPGEELNYHGLLNDTSSPLLGANYGYPSCFALWNVTDFPSQGDLVVGSQFSLDNDATVNDTSCAESTTPPRLTFEAHTAPLDIEFLPANGSRAFISFHGSWNRDRPAGYKLAYVPFSSAGEPADQSDSRAAARDILTAPDVTQCSRRGACFRPVGLAFDAAAQRLFVSSDATGEIWVVLRDGDEEEEEEEEEIEGRQTPTDTSAQPGSTSSGAATPGAALRGVGAEGWVVVVAVTAWMMVVGGLGFVV
ncbi:soluble quino protein glucose dehydrogenase [Thermothelomyces heterothallicus CBS 203.75]